MKKTGMKFGGQVRVQVLNPDDSVAQETGWQPNLILDQGMNALAEIFIADIFKYCAAGTVNTTTSRTTAGNISQAGSGSTTLVCSAGDFTANDVGRVIRNISSNEVRRIIAFTDTTHVEVDIADAIAGGHQGKIYNVEQTALFAEVERTAHCQSNGNGTSTTTNTRTFTRSFIFGPQQSGAVTYREIGFSHLDAKPIREISDLTLGADIVTITSPDVLMQTTGDNVVIAGVVGSVPDINGAHAITILSDDTFSISVPGVTFAGSGGSFAPEAIEHNLNIRVVLGSPITVNLNQRLKVVYAFVMTVSPDTTITATAPITGGTGVQFGSVNGKYVIEKFATSLVNLDGTTDSSSTQLDPCTAAPMAMSDDSSALIPLTGAVIRQSNVDTVESEPEDVYLLNSFTRSFIGLFDLEDANSASIRSLMPLYDDSNHKGAFTFLFDTVQTKNNSHSLTVIVSKTWDRTLA